MTAKEVKLDERIVQAIEQALTNGKRVEIVRMNDGSVRAFHTARKELAKQNTDIDT